MLTFSCNQEDGYEEKQMEETVDMEQKVWDFFAIDEAFYQSLLEDPDFVKLCDVYDEQSGLSLDEVLAGLGRENEILDMIDSLSAKYERDNIFAYVMHYEDQKRESRSPVELPDYAIWEIVNVTRHEWGECFLGSPTSVCDIAKNWQEAWTLCAYQEVLANQRLGNRLDLNAYRCELESFLGGQRPNLNYGTFFNRYKGYIDPLIAGGYDNIINRPTSMFVFDIYTYALCGGPKICEFVIFLQAQFELFLYTGLWENCIRNDGLTENDSDFSSPGGVIDGGNVVSNSYIGCILQDVLGNNNVLGILHSFVGEYSIAHLKWELSSEGFNLGETGMFEPNMERFWFTIKLNEKLLPKLPVLLVAQTMVHEAVHADLFMKMYMFRRSMPDGTLSVDEIVALDDALSVQDFPTLNEYYEKFYSEGMIAGVHHQYMAEYMVSAIAGILEEIYPGEVPFVYEAIAWQGLKRQKVRNLETGVLEERDTEAWKNLPDAKKALLDGFYEEYMRDPSNYTKGGCL